MAIAKTICQCEVCGKDFEVRVHKRNRTEADEFETWAAENITVCRQCQWEQQKKEEHERALKFSDGLPELKGTEKQVEWAFDIRGKFADLSMMAPRTKEFFSTAFLSRINSASWWIDHRDAKDSNDLLIGMRRGRYGKAEVEELLRLLDKYYPKDKAKEE